MSDENQTYRSAFTFKSLEALEEAIVGGELTVKYTDKEVTYRSLDEMLKARGIIMRALGLTKSPRYPGLFGGSRIIAKHSKGLTSKGDLRNQFEDDPSEPGEFD